MILSGKRVLITRPHTRAQEFASALMREGAIPIVFPVTEILPPHDFLIFDSALENLSEFDWLVFTSVYGVEAFINRLTVLGIKQIPAELRVAAIGKKTMLSLQKNNVKTDFVPSEFTSKAIAEEIERTAGSRFLLLQSDLSDPELGERIQSKGGQVNEVTAYQNIPAQVNKSDVEALKIGVDIITFTSPSGVKGFIHTGHEHGFDVLHLPGNPIVACIGPVTAKAIKDAGMNVDVEAAEHTTEGIIKSLVLYPADKPQRSVYK